MTIYGYTINYLVEYTVDYIDTITNNREALILSIVQSMYRISELGYGNMAHYDILINGCDEYRSDLGKQ